MCSLPRSFSPRETLLEWEGQIAFRIDLGARDLAKQGAVFLVTMMSDTPRMWLHQLTDATENLCARIHLLLC